MAKYWSSACELPALTERKIDAWNCCRYSTTSAAEKPAAGGGGYDTSAPAHSLHSAGLWGGTKVPQALERPQLRMTRLDVLRRLAQSRV